MHLRLLSATALLLTASLEAAEPMSAAGIVVEPVICSCDQVGCTMTWTDAGADSYGATVEFEAAWTDAERERSAAAKLDLDDRWSCDGRRCIATATFETPNVPATAAISYEGLVRGLTLSMEGRDARDFIRTSASCRLIG